jgi:iron complex outermembrane receptor protein
MRTLFGSTAMAVLIVSSATSAHAQTAAPATLEEIVVTAQKRAENMQDVPVAVSAETARSLAAKGVEGTADLTVTIPGLSYTQVVGSALPRIRGIGSAISLGGNENPIATYIDGVYIAAASSSVLAFNNIEQVAVLKGPQGTLFGRNATGGLIQITTRDPVEVFGGEGSVTYGNLQTVGGQLYLTGGPADGLAGDLAIYYRDQKDGFGRNLLSGAQVNKSRDFAARTKWKFERDGVVARASLDYAVTSGVLPAFRATKGSLPVTGIPFTGDDFDTNSDVDPQLKNEQWGASLQLNKKIGEIELVSITGYRRSQFHAVFDIDKLPLFINRSDLRQPSRQFSQELQLLSPSGKRFGWVIGAYYFDASSSYDPLLIDNGAAADINVSSEQGTKSAALFGQASYRLSQATGLTAGLRYTTEKKDFKARGDIVTPAGVRIPGATLSDSIEVEKVTWRLALDHHFSDDLMGYASYNRGFKSGGFNPQRFTAPLSPFQPEVLDAWEVGLKSEFLNRRVRLNAATFYYDYKNIQINAFVNGISTIYNAASAEIYGLDLDLTAAPTDQLTITAGLALLHDRFGDFPGASISRPAVPNGTTVLGGNIVGVGNAKGNRLPLTPDWTFNLGAIYVVPLETGILEFSANYFHNDGWRAEADNRLRQVPYDLVNASATWFLDSERAKSVKLWAKNLTNEAYAIQMNAQPPADGVSIGSGRTYGVTLGARF